MINLATKNATEVAGLGFRPSATLCRRREFLVGGGAAFGALGALGVAGGVLPPAGAKRKVRFGVFTDSHYSTREGKFRDSRAKLRKAIDEFNKGGLDFVIELGDLKDCGIPPNRAETLGFLDAIEAEFARFNGPRYHVLGNHDMDSISKEDFLSHTENHGEAKGKGHYSFIVGGIKFIVLDACFNEDMTPYRCGNFNWMKAFIPDDELAWFDEELKGATTPAVVFCHQMLDGFSEAYVPEKGVFVGNWKRVVDVMEKRGNVCAAIQGHHHWGYCSFRNGIHYWTVKSMLTSSHSLRNSYAIVEVSPEGDVSIKGFYDCESSHFLNAHK